MSIDFTCHWAFQIASANQRNLSFTDAIEWSLPMAFLLIWVLLGHIFAIIIVPFSFNLIKNQICLCVF